MKLLLMAVALAAAPADQQFDLVCSGTLATKSFYTGDKVEAYSYAYRIDLDQKLWCTGNCGVRKPIHDVQPVVLTLEPPVDINTPTEKRFFMTSIDRTTGKQSTLSTSGRRMDILILKWDGQCEKRPFSGFPDHDTKF